jgi:hypothetical protein
MVVAEDIVLVKFGEDGPFPIPGPVGLAGELGGEGRMSFLDTAIFGENHGAAVGSGIMGEPSLAAFPVDGMVGDLAFSFGQPAEDIDVRSGNMGLCHERFL